MQHSNDSQKYTLIFAKFYYEVLHQKDNNCSLTYTKVHNKKEKKPFQKKVIIVKGLQKVW